MYTNKSFYLWHIIIFYNNNMEEKHINEGTNIITKFNDLIKNTNNVETIGDRLKIHTNDKTIIDCNILSFVGVYVDYKDEENPVYESISDNKSILDNKRKIKIMFLYNSKDIKDDKEYKKIDDIVKEFRYESLNKNSKDVKEYRIKYGKDVYLSPFYWKTKQINNIEWKYSIKYGYEIDFVEIALNDLMHYIISKLKYNGLLSFEDSNENIMRYYFVRDYKIIDKKI